jgi:O-antigen biosynthesis protein WbqV
MRKNLTKRQYLIVLHDLLATAAAILLTFVMRFDGPVLDSKIPFLKFFLPGFVCYALIVYLVVGLHRNKWRFTSVPDLSTIVRASSILAASLLAFDYVLVAPNVYGQFFFGKITILLYWFLQMAFLGGSRVAYRFYHYSHTIHRAKESDAQPVLIVGRAADAEVLLRAIESGAVKRIWPAGILSNSSTDRGQSIRGISVLGDMGDVEAVLSDLANRGIRVSRLLLTPSALVPEANPESVLVRARKLGISVSQIPSLDAEHAPPRIAPVSVEDLLLRPTVEIDYRRLERLISGKAVVVTGGGGSIGSEICERVLTFGAARLLVLENSEPALHAVLESLRQRDAEAEITGRIADVRERDRILRLIGEFKPDLVFHAAALKHVPLLERDWDEGVKTNVFGSVNVSDAAVAAGAAAMVMISTDKAIEPVSVLGATKRLAEMYCDALDGSIDRKERATKTRLISVRFGNVLASNGSVVPKFKAQIEAGGPVTVTHPEMVRYFMTIREACDLVLTSASHAVASERSDASVYVLNMGQPVRILDLAERIIRLSGLEPGRDIAIEFTGIRPGERLHEILFAREEETAEIGIPGVLAARPLQPSLDSMRVWLAQLDKTLGRNEPGAIYSLLSEVLPEFRGRAA